MTLTAVTGGLIFNFTTNGNGELLKSRLPLLIEQPALLGVLLACLYGIASLAQVLVGRMIDRMPMKWLMLGIVAIQPVLFALASLSSGWTLYALMILFMIFVFGAIPFTDALIVRFVDDRMRSRVTGMRLAVSFGVSSLAVWMLGPLVKAAGFGTLLASMAAISACAALFVLWLPPEPASTAPSPANLR
jgi:predicted MFS family arabinose efflux permease